MLLRGSYAGAAATGISAAPATALYDAPMTIRVHTAARQRVLISADTVDARGRRWRSEAWFSADRRGVVDVTRDAPRSGSYRGIDAMGLFWSMRTDSASPFAVPGVFTPMSVRLSVSVGGKVVGSTIATRLGILANVRRTPIVSGTIVGTLFAPADHRRHPGVVVLGGSEGGLDESDAALLASHGFAAFAAGYFGVGSLPKDLVDVPVETVLSDVRFLSSQPSITGDVAILGTSRGGELALLSASLSSHVSAVVGIVASSIIEPGLRFGSGPVQQSPWTYRGKPLAFASFAELSTYLRSGDVSSVRKAVIPVERIDAPVLLIAGGDDRLGFSAPLSKLAYTRLRSVRRPFRDMLLTYPDAGHLIGPPYLPTAHLRTLKTPYGALTFGGSAIAYARADADSWPTLLAFLDRALRQARQRHRRPVVRG